MPCRSRIATALVCSGLLWSAGCGSKPPAPAAPVHAQTQPEKDEPGEPAPSHDPFEQPDDVPVDSKALLKELRHDCCTELPAAEVEQHRPKD